MVLDILSSWALVSMIISKGCQEGNLVHWFINQLPLDLWGRWGRLWLKPGAVGRLPCQSCTEAAIMMGTETAQCAEWLSLTRERVCSPHSTGRRQSTAALHLHFLSVLKAWFSISLWYTSLLLPAVRAGGQAIKGIINHQVPTGKGQTAAGFDKATIVLSPMEL